MQWHLYIFSQADTVAAALNLLILAEPHWPQQGSAARAEHIQDQSQDLFAQKTSQMSNWLLFYMCTYHP